MKKGAKSVRLSGSEIAVNVLFWAAMTLTVVGLFIYGGYQISRWREGKALHFFRLTPKTAPVKAKAEVKSKTQRKEKKSSSYMSASSELKKVPPSKKEETVEDTSEADEAEKSVQTDQNMMRGLVIDFKDSEKKPISTETQARFFLDIALKDLDELEDGQGVALTYSANYGQTKALAAAYLKGKSTAGIKGSNQAAVVKAMENLLRNDENYKPLRRRMHIIPITTLGFGEEDPEEIIIRDMENLACHLGAGWRVYGWQNQDTNFSTSKKFAIGGGIVKNQSKKQFYMIQHSLLSLSEKYDLLNTNSSQSEIGWKAGITAKAARRYAAAIQLGQRNRDPLAFVKTWFDPSQSKSSATKISKDR